MFKINRLLQGVMGIVLYFIVFSANAEVRQDISYKYYTFTPSNNQTLYQAAKAVNSIRENGKTYLGYTKWDYFWNYKYQINQKTKQCYLTSHVIDIKITITLPMLMNARRDQYEKFNKFIPKLRMHENNHAKIALNYAHNLDNILKRLPPQPNCKILKQTIDRLAKKQVALSNKANKEYDTKTDHGRTEGAIL